MASIAPQESVTRGRGKSWAYAGAIVGGAVSVAANVAHSFRPPKGSPANWSPQLGAVALAAFWPMALLLAVEVMVRVDWPRARRWTAVRFGGVTPVAIVAAIVSYRHLSGLLDWYGEDGVTVALGPLAVDGLMVVSTGALLALASRIGSGVAVPRQADASDGASASDALDRIESDASVAPIASDAGEGIGSHSIGSESIGSDDRIESTGRESIESSDASGAEVVSIESHRHDGAASRSAKRIEPRAEDVARIREAIRSGGLTEPLRVSHVMSHLSIGPTYAKAAVQHVNAQGSDGQAEA
jgi:hypothetical protein